MGRHRKPPGQRVRRNREVRHELPSDGPPDPPELPPTYRAHGERVRYLADTRAWWETWLGSPQRDRFTSTDWQRLLMLARVVDAYHRTGDPKLLSEVRLNEEKLGATARDRNNLGWDLTPKPRGQRDAGDASTSSEAGERGDELEERRRRLQARAAEG